MLQEVKNVSQYKGEPFRRWFFSAKVDLTVWYDKLENIVGFQLCYRKERGEKALTWKMDKGYAHQTVDDGEIEPFEPKGIPILINDGVFDQNKITLFFEEQASNLDNSLRNFVIEKLKSYPNYP